MAKTLSANRAPTFGRILERLNQMPPFFIYYALGHRQKTRVTLKEMSAISGIPKRTFGRIASSLSYDDIRPKYIDPFFKACGVDPLSNDRLRNYLRATLKTGRPFSHLNNSQLKHFNMLSARYLKMKEDKSNPVAAAWASHRSQSD